MEGAQMLSGVETTGPAMQTWVPFSRWANEGAGKECGMRSADVKLNTRAQVQR